MPKVTKKLVKYYTIPQGFTNKEIAAVRHDTRDNSFTTLLKDGKQIDCIWDVKFMRERVMQGVIVLPRKPKIKSI